jgi:RNA polymerase sigma-70 factor, ECF subfamily
MQPNSADKSNMPKVLNTGSGDPVTDKELVAAAKSGDELAFEMLVKCHQPRVFAIALCHLRVHEEAEDIVQQTFQKVFVHLRKFQGKSSFSTWLTRIAINESLLLHRGRAVREVSIHETNDEEETWHGPEISDSSLDPEVRYLQREEARILSLAMAELRPGMRVAMELRELRELSGPETARQLGVSVSAVKACVFNGRRKLREIIRHSGFVSKAQTRHLSNCQ